MLSRAAVVDASEHHHQGDRYHVHAAVTLRNRELEIARTPASDCSHADLCVAVDHTFDTLCRPVQATVRAAKKTAVFW